MDKAAAREQWWLSALSRNLLRNLLRNLSRNSIVPCGAAPHQLPVNSRHGAVKSMGGHTVPLPSSNMPRISMQQLSDLL